MKTKLFLLSLIAPLLGFGQYSNGPLSTGATSNSGVAAPAGYTWSEVQNNAGNTTESNTNSGFSCLSPTFFCADDFTVPAGQIWQISTIEVFGYQTNYTGATSPFTALTLNIYSSDPASPAAVSVFGDDTTNRMTSSSDALMYRTFNTTVPTATTPGTTRKIWKITGAAATTLVPNNYWLKFQLETAASSFVPGVTIQGSRGLPTFNGQQYNATTSAWTPIVDLGNPATAPDYPQAFPFIVNYTNLATNEVMQFDSRVQVYPNPASDFFSISLPSESKNLKTKITLYDASGKLVKQYLYAEKYDSSALQPGIYNIRIDDGMNIKTAKLIKK